MIPFSNLESFFSSVLNCCKFIFFHPIDSTTISVQDLREILLDLTWCILSTLNKIDHVFSAAQTPKYLCRYNIVWYRLVIRTFFVPVGGGRSIICAIVLKGTGNRTDPRVHTGSIDIPKCYVFFLFKHRSRNRTSTSYNTW